MLSPLASGVKTCIQAAIWMPEFRAKVSNLRVDKVHVKAGGVASTPPA